MSQNNKLVFQGLSIVAWIIFVGLCIEAGALIFNFAYSMFKPVVAAHLYQKLDLSDMYQRSKSAYVGMHSFLIVIACMKAYLFYIVIQVMMKLDLANPFNQWVANQIQQMSYYACSIGIMSYIAREVAKNLQHHGYEIHKLNEFWADSQAYILMSAVIYVIATIFTKGVALQNENELTI